MSRAESDPIEMTVVGGYLGAGKTTLVNHVLRRADERVAVLVNDFGEVNIDADLIAAGQNGAEGDGVVRLANGCICCTMADGLASALQTLAAVEPRPRRLLVEASGVSDPQTVAAYGHTPGFEVNAVVVVVDAETFLARLRDPYVGDTVERQLDGADLVVVNKVSLAGPERVAEVRAWLAEHQPSAAVVATDHSDVPLEVLFGPVDRGPVDHEPADHDHGAHARFETWTVRIEEPVPRSGVEALMASLPPEVMRAKGFVRLVDEPGMWLLQRVGSRWTLEPTNAVPSATGLFATGPADYGTALVIIGVPGAVDPGQLQRVLSSN